MLDAFTVDGVRDMVKEYLESPVTEFPSSWRLNDLIEKRQKYNMDRRTLTEYLFYSSAEQGFADNVNNFIYSWCDYLDLQEEYFGKVIDKYSETLLTDERKLSYKVEQLRAFEEKEKFNDVVNELFIYEWENEEYKVIVPKTAEDMIEEARSQSNCLSSYIGKMADGRTRIFFLRKKKDENKSFVTIEVREDNSLGQVKAKFNKEPSREALEVVRKWHNEVYLKRAA